MLGNFPIEAGHPYPLGATFDGEGANFAVFSQHATRVVLCLFDEQGNESQLVILPECEGHVWHGYVPGMRPGQQYGFRMDGPYKPEEGHRFNPFKLLIDPYAKRLTGHPTWNDALFGYTVGDPKADLSFDKRDSGPYMPRCVVTDPAFSWSNKPRPHHTMSETVIYEAHVKGLTAGHPKVERAGTYMAMASDPILEHLNTLGVTTIELLPVQAFIDDKFLHDKG
ncbi:MAG: isoamylase, partial [Dinoroseobacter sp.]